MAYGDATRIDRETLAAHASVRETLRTHLKTFGETSEAFYQSDTRNLQGFRDQLIDLTRWLCTCLRIEQT